MSKLLITDKSFITDKQIYNAFHEKYICIPDIGLLIDKETLILVGTLNDDGYIKTSFKEKSFGVHQIIFCMFHGYIPKIVDHINRNRADNRIENLREISATGNMINKDVNKKKPLGIKGVNWERNNKRWRVTIRYNNKLVHIGSFKNFLNAVRARHYAEQQFGYDEYDIVSAAQKYLMWIGKFSFSTNIKLEEENKYNKDSIKSEWDFFLLTKKQKIDNLIKK